MIIDTRISNLINVIKGQIELLEELSENFCKLEGLLYIGMQADLSCCSEKIIEGYLWSIRDLIIHSSEINEAVQQNLSSAK